MQLVEMAEEEISFGWGLILKSIGSFEDWAAGQEVVESDE